MPISRKLLAAKPSSEQKISGSQDLEIPKAPIVVMDNPNENDGIARLEFYDKVLTIVYRHQICGKLDNQIISKYLTTYLPLTEYRPQPVDDTACTHFAVQDKYRMHTHIGFDLPLNNPKVMKLLVNALQSMQSKFRKEWQTKQDTYHPDYREKICTLKLISDTEPFLNAIETIFSPQRKIQSNRNCFWRDTRGNINIMRPDEVTSLHIPTQLMVSNQILREYRSSLNENKMTSFNNNGFAAIGALLLMALVIGCAIFNCRKNRKTPMKIR